MDDGIISKDVEMTSGNIDSDFCETDTSISVALKPNSSHTLNVTSKNISVEFKSNTGIHSDPIIYWASSVSEDISGIIGEWKQLDLTIPSNKSQEASILQGNAIVLTKDFITP